MLIETHIHYFAAVDADNPVRHCGKGLVMGDDDHGPAPVSYTHLVF